MNPDNKYVRCAETDPCRCQGLIQSGAQGGQCCYKAIPGSKFCPMHGGQQLNSQAKYHLAKYRLEQYGMRVSEFAGDDNIKSLRDEVGILRMTLESLLNQCKQPNQLLLFIDKITTLVNQIRQTIESTHKLEEKTNQLLDRKVIVLIADNIVQIIGEHVKDPDVLLKIGEQVCASIAGAASPPSTIGLGA